MPYWVYGIDASTGQDRDPFFCDVKSDEAARKLASDEGIRAETVEFVAAAAEKTPAGTLESARDPRTAKIASALHFARHRVGRGFIWIIAGIVLIVISLIVSAAANDYVMSGTVGQAFGRASRLQWLVGCMRLLRIGGIASAAIGAVMWIVDTSPKRGRV